MLGSQIYLFAFLLLAADTLGARLQYTAKYKVGDEIKRTNTAAGDITDEKGENIVEHMKEWSDNKYSASKLKRGGIYAVINVEPAASKGKASEEIQEMRSIVAKNT